jgi:nicotinate-nucleotide pyrophosphorylase (carboxylating)
LRLLEKEAVRAGGGVNHRASLEEAVLIKDNHIVVAGDIATAVRAAKQTRLRVEVECDTLDQVREALEAGADELLLDNMDVQTMARAVDLAAGRAQTEASGGITLDTIAAIAATGVDSISVGALTHSAPAVDLSLEVEVL